MGRRSASPSPALEQSWKPVNLSKVLVAFVQATRVERAQECAVENVHFLHAANLTAENQPLIVRETPRPAAFRLLGNAVEELGNLLRLGFGGCSVVEQRGIECARDGGLFDNEPRVTRVEAIEKPLDSPGLHDDVAKVLSCARLPGAEFEHGISQTTVDQVILKAALILEVSLERPFVTL